MKDVKISNTKALEEELNNVQHRCTSRTITCEQITDCLKQIENHLGITKKALEGTRIEADLNAQTFPRAYKYIPESTIFNATFRRGNWYITSITREPTWKRSTRNVKITLTDEAKVEAMNALLNPTL